MDVECAVAVLGKKRIIGTAKLPAIAPAQRNSEFVPLVIRIEGDQRVIKIKQGNFLFHSFSSIALIKGTVMARCVCSA